MFFLLVDVFLLDSQDSYFVFAERWKTTKPELFALIEAGFKMCEKIYTQEMYNEEIQSLIKSIDPRTLPSH